jgi:DnaK suppressor protein
MATMVKVEVASAKPRANDPDRKWPAVVEALLRERRRALQGPPAACEGGPDPVDTAREREEEAVWIAALNCSRDMQATVEEALRRLATGQYGLCVECGQHIALARLRALSFAVRCLACQERFEHENEGGRAPVPRHGGSGLSHDERPLGPRRTMTAPTRNGR